MPRTTSSMLVSALLLLALPACFEEVVLPYENAGETDAATSTSTTNATTAAAVPTSSGGSDNSSPATSGSEGSTSGAGLGETPSACSRCVLETPAGWSGPVVRRMLEPDHTGSACGGDWPEEVARAFTTVRAEPPTCGCNCTPHVGVCSNTAMLVRHSPTASNCQGTPEATYTFPPSDRPIEGNTEGRRWGLLGGTQPATCTSTVSMGAAAAPEIEGEVRLCNGAASEANACESGQMCVSGPAAPFAEGVCVWREGQHACPAGYDEQTLYHQEFVDARDCSPCACAPDSTLACDDRRVFVHISTGPQSGGGLTLANGECRIIENEVEHATFSPGTPRTPSCDVTTPSTATGSVTATDPITVCCTPD